MNHTESVEKRPLLGLDPQELQAVAADCGLPRFAASQLARWLYVRRVATFAEMTDISLRGRRALEERYVTGREAPLGRVQSADGTAKYLFRGAGSRDVEAVMIPDRDRRTLCVSSQAGCRMGCRFCMTGRQGFHGQLTAAQILNQLLSVDEAAELTNVVFMGMGEPLDNLPELLRAIAVITAPWGLAWSPKRVTVSTVGRIDELRTLVEQTQVHLAVSVHNPFASERLAMMPAQKGWPIARVIDLLRGHDFAHQRRLSIEYIMWRGVNDDARHADELIRLIGRMPARVNLIRFHAIPGFEGLTASEQTMTAFRRRLNDAGITATIRASRGEDIMAACGMLAGSKEARADEE